MKRTKSLTVVGIMSLILVLAFLLLMAAPAPGIAGEKATKNIGVKSSFLTYIIEENPAYLKQAGV